MAAKRRKRRHPDQYIDEWLDEEARPRERKGRKQRSVPEKEKNREIPPDRTNATVTEVFPNCCRVRMDDSVATPLCQYKRNAVFGRTVHGLRQRSPVAVGDRVKTTVYGSSDGVVEGVAARRNHLARPAPGREDAVVHVLAANVDLLVIVASVHEPDFSPGLVDRFLVAAQAASIPALLCVNKVDLAGSGHRPWALYEEIGIETVSVSASTGEGIEPLRRRLTGVSAVFCGHSGVGKTSTLSALLGHEVGRVGEVSESTGKGRHTTTGAVMLEGPEGSRWIDTPGVRSFGLTGVAPDELIDFFPELKGLGETEAGNQPRYESYLRIRESLEAGEG